MMRKIVAGLFMSLDGVVESPEQWHFPYADDELNGIVAAQMAESDTMLFGRRTWEAFAAYWPQQRTESPIAAALNAAPKLVASNTLSAADAWANTELVTGDVAGELARLKQTDGGDISITGSATLVRSLLEAGILDELRLLVHPILVGAGSRLFDASGARVPLTLLGSRTLPTGVVYLTYGRAA
jgi:dihydrofolate reductase